MRVYLQSTVPGKEDVRFDIISYDPATKRGKIRGSLGTVFDEDLSKEFLTKYGYKVVKETADA